MNGLNVSGTIRLAQGSKGRLLLLLVLSADGHARMNTLAAADVSRPGTGTHKLPWAGAACSVPAAAGGHLSSGVSDSSGAESPNHPYIDENELKSDTCLTCHPTKDQGKYVHTAVGMGCDNCHKATSRNGQTSVTLRAQGGSLCAKCHAINNKRIQHAPYAQGACLICHNPHSAAYPAETRAAASTLCLVCHMPNQPGAALSADGKRFSLLDGITYDRAEWERAPKINSQHGGKATVGGPSNQVGAKDSGKVNAEADCLACHQPHASKAEHLLRSHEGTGGATVWPSDAGRLGFRSTHSGLWGVPEHQGSILRGHA